MSEQSREVRSDVAAWVRKAEQDWITVGSLDPSVVASVICFHCQQCAEKYLKALLTQHDEVPPRSHDLGLLLGVALQIEAGLSEISEELRLLDRYSVAIRYPGPDADEDEAAAAGRAARVVRDACRALLQLDELEADDDTTTGASGAETL
jgi:HEPN domain-containing protein